MQYLIKLVLFLLLPIQAYAEFRIIRSDGETIFRQLAYNEDLNRVSMIVQDNSFIFDAMPSRLYELSPGQTSFQVLDFKQPNNINETAIALNISRDAKYITGEIYDQTNNLSNGAIWTRQNINNLTTASSLNLDNQQLLHPWSNGVVAQNRIVVNQNGQRSELGIDDHDYGNVFDVSVDGNVQVGQIGLEFPQPAVAAYWQDNQINFLGLSNEVSDLELTFSIAEKVSPNGLHIGGRLLGEDSNGNFVSHLLVWNGNNKEPHVLRQPNGQFLAADSSIYDITNTGYVVGHYEFVQNGSLRRKGYIWHKNFENNRIRLFEDWIKEKVPSLNLNVEMVKSILNNKFNGNFKIIFREKQGFSTNNVYLEFGEDVTINSQSQYSLWNTNLNMLNILELINNTNTTQLYSADIYDISGNLVNTINGSLNAGQQFDLLTHDIEGVTDNSYGIIDVKGNITGRMLYYKQNGVNDFDFAFAIPLNDSPTLGTSFVGFNTFQPSFVPVSNWLSVVNLESAEKTFIVKKYNDAGILLSESSLNLAPFSRFDLDGGHIVPGAFQVGLLEVVPVDQNANYLAQLIRYGDRSANVNDFAFPLLSSNGKSGEVYVPISTVSNAENWLEVINPNSFEINVEIEVYNNSGSLISTLNQTLEAKSQKHTSINQIFNNVQNLGHVKITSANRVLAQSMVYERRSVGGELVAMYGLQDIDMTNNVQSNSFNMFIGIENYLRINNITDAPVTYTLKIQPFDENTPTVLNLFLNPRESRELDLNNLELYGTKINAYGSVIVETPNSDDVFYYVLRKHNDTSGIVDFASPTLSR